MNTLSISTNHIIVVVLLLIIVFSLTGYGFYKLIKAAVKKGTSEAIEKQNKKN